MEVYVLDENFQTIDVLDDFESVIWTERYSPVGETKLEVGDTPKNRLLLREGLFLATPSSPDPALIETFLSEDNKLQLTAPHLLNFFKNRFMRRSWDNKYGSVVFADNPAVIPNEILAEFCIAGTPGGIMESGDVIGAINGPLELIPNLSYVPPDVQDFSLFPGFVRLAIPNGTVFDGIKGVLDAYNLGARLRVTNVTETDYDLVFQVYAGKDRTSAQTVNPVVRFQSAMETLTNTKELRSIAGYRNVSWAFAPNVLAPDPYVGYAFETPEAQYYTGFKRRTLQVLADDIQQSDVDLTTSDGRAAYQDLLDQRALNGLINNNYVRMADGTIVPQAAFVYGVDYSLGDIIELGVESGAISTARVVEHIIAQDSNGESEYPTLSVIS